MNFNEINESIHNLKSDFTIEKYFELSNDLNNIRNSKLDLYYSIFRNNFCILSSDDDMDFETMSNFKMKLISTLYEQCKEINKEYKSLKNQLDQVYFENKIIN